MLNLVSVREASNMLGVTTSQVNKLIGRGVIGAQMVGSQYVIDKTVVEHYRDNRRSAGRPRKVV